MPRSPERRAILIGLVLVIEGLLSVRVGFASFEQRQAALALLTGWFVTGNGLLAWLQVPSSRIGPLLVAAGAAWFIAGFRWLDVDAISRIAGVLALLYAGVVSHAILVFPEGRVRDRRTGIAICVTYVASLAAPPLGSTLVAIALLLGLAVGRSAHRLDRTQRRGPAVVVGVLFAAALVAGQVIAMVVPGGARFDGRFIVQIAFMAVALDLTAALVHDSDRRARMTDLVVDLDPARGGLARELAAAIGDPTLEVGYWLPEQDRFIDSAGRPVTPPGPGSTRRSTPIDRDGTPVAVLIHDPKVTADPAVRAAIARAATLATANARLQADVQAQARAVEASRRRILAAAEDERRDLDVRIRERIHPTFAAMEAAIDDAAAPEDPSLVDPALELARDQLRLVRHELAGLTDALHPRVLDEFGIRGAVEAASARSPVPATVTWDADGTLGRDVEAALYFVCAEALANVAKHAEATRVAVRVRRSPHLITLEVEDDGRGGARIGDGSGLQGLQDRLTTVGGALAIQTPASGGTRLMATIPIEPAP